MRNRSRIFSAALPVVLGCAWLAGPSAARGADEPVPPDKPAVVPLDVPDGMATERRASKEELLARLKTRQAQLELDHARAAMDRAAVEHEQTRRLYDQKIVTVDELNRARQAHDQAVLAHRKAEIDLEQTRLGFLQDATLVTVIDARKYRTETGQYMATVTIRNDSDLGKARTAMKDDGVLPDDRLGGLLQIDNVIVTLMGQVTSSGDDRGLSLDAIVGDPYQQIVPALGHKQSVELEYKLLKKDVEAVTVRIEYLGTTREYPVFLKRESSEQLPTVTSSQYAQQGQLGSKIRYDLVLERLGKEEQSFSLLVLNLPTQIKFGFMDPRSDARVTQVKFTEEISKQGIDLEISIPQKLDQEFVDRNINFAVVVTRPAELKIIGELRQKYRGQDIPTEEVAKIKGSRVDLILIPKGIGKLDIVMSNQYKELRKGESAVFKFSILNSGTLALRNVTPKLDLPLEWEGTLAPTTADMIEPAEKTDFKTTVDMPPDVVVGEYVIKISAEGHSGVETVEGLDKNMTIRVAAKRNVTGTAVLVLVLIVMVVIIAVATVRISRR